MTRTLPLLLVGACIEYRPRGEDLWPPSVPNLPDPPSELVVDDIVQVQTPKVDVLWVIDNSCSMDDEQTALVANFPAFMDYFLGSGLDYHIGVTSTDLDRDTNGSKGKLVTIGGEKYIDPDTADATALFTSMATLGTTGSGTEKGMGATFMALETNRETINAGYYRDEAAIHTIVISDEPDMTEAALITEPEFVAWYADLKDDQDDRTFSSIIDFDDGGRYRNLTNELGGILWDITSDDWPQLLEWLGVQAAGLNTEYFLSQLPQPATLDVRVVTAEGSALPPFVQGTDYSYDGGRNSIRFFEFIPDPLSHVVITYEAASSGFVVEDDLD
jgi:hypothetical protein